MSYVDAKSLYGTIHLGKKDNVSEKSMFLVSLTMKEAWEKNRMVSLRDDREGFVSFQGKILSDDSSCCYVRIG